MFKKLAISIITFSALSLSGCKDDIDLNEQPEMVVQVYNSCQNEGHNYSNKTCSNASLIMYSKAEKEQRKYRSELRKKSIEVLIAEPCSTEPNRHTKISECEIKTTVLSEMKTSVDMEYSFIRLEDLMSHELSECNDDSYRCQSFKTRLSNARKERKEVIEKVLAKTKAELQGLSLKDFIEFGYKQSCNDTFISFLRSPEIAVDDTMVLDPESGILYPDIPKQALSKDLVMEPSYKYCAALESLYPSYFIHAVKLKRKQYDHYLYKYKKSKFLDLYRKKDRKCPNVSSDYPEEQHIEDVQYNTNPYCMAVEHLMHEKRSSFLAERKQEFIDTYRKYENKTYSNLYTINKKFKCKSLFASEYWINIKPEEITLPTDNIYCMSIRKALHNKYENEMLKMNSSSEYLTEKANSCVKDMFSYLKIASQKRMLTGTSKQKRSYEQFINRSPSCQAAKNILNVYHWNTRSDYECHYQNQSPEPDKPCQPTLFE